LRCGAALALARANAWRCLSLCVALRCRGGVFVFTFVVPPVYPHEPPKVKCKTKARTQRFLQATA
jgi:hypothetical protein